MEQQEVVNQLNKKWQIEDQNIINNFFQWYYLEMTKLILRIWKNFLIFILNYFSISSLLKTFFSPWKNYRESYGRGFDLKRYLTAFFSNILFSLLGMFTRIFLLIISFLLQFFIALGGMIVFLIWIFLPLLLVVGIVVGFQMMF